MKRKTKTKVDLSGWELDAVDEIGKALKAVALKAASEALALALEDDETYLMFPAEWSEIGSDGCGGKLPKDPMTVYLRIALQSDMLEPVTYEMNLREALTGTLETCAEDGSFAPGLERIRDGFRELADQIDAAITAGRESV